MAVEAGLGPERARPSLGSVDQALRGLCGRCPSIDAEGMAYAVRRIDAFLRLIQGIRGLRLRGR